MLERGSPWRPAVIDALQTLLAMVVIQALLFVLSRSLDWASFALITLVLIAVRVMLKRPRRS